MAILTHKELRAKAKGEPQKKEASEAFSIDGIQEEIKEQVFEYKFFYPENPKDYYLDFEEHIKLNGKPYIVKCVRGVIKTRHKELQEFLKDKGYIFLNKKEVK